jgi:hypothetical protein
MPQDETERIGYTISARRKKAGYESMPRPTVERRQRTSRQMSPSPRQQWRSFSRFAVWWYCVGGFSERAPTFTDNVAAVFSGRSQDGWPNVNPCQRVGTEPNPYKEAGRGDRARCRDVDRRMERAGNRDRRRYQRVLWQRIYREIFPDFHRMDQLTRQYRTGMLRRNVKAFLRRARGRKSPRSIPVTTRMRPRNRVLSPRSSTPAPVPHDPVTPFSYRQRLSIIRAWASDPLWAFSSSPFHL